MRIATWNINSVRLRIDQLCRFIEETRPDIVCLQETKCPSAQFPAARLARLGYHHIVEHGVSGHHGVAIVSRLQLEIGPTHPFCGQLDGRHVCARLASHPAVTVHSLYVPAGGDDPDPQINPKFAHKLAFLDEMKDWAAALHRSPGETHIIAGDLNVAPLASDVWSHQQLLKVVSHTPPETSRLAAILEAGGFVDPIREHHPEPEQLFTWWSYRSKEWRASNRGRRLDHIWLTRNGSMAARNPTIATQTRDWERPSDHVPVIVDLAISI